MGYSIAMEAIAGWVILQWGWRRALTALAAGALSALAMPPFGVFPVLFATYPVLVWLIDGSLGDRGGRRGAMLSAAVAGWWFGLGFFVAGLWWIGEAFLVEAETFAWMMPFAVLGLPAFLALFYALAATLARLFWVSGPSRLLVFTAAFTLAEAARGILFTGFPWNLPGHALAGSSALMQTASLVGDGGLTALALAIFASPAALAPAGGRRRILWPAAALLLLAAMAGFGVDRLRAPLAEASPPFRIRIVQPSIDQREKWRPENRNEVFSTYLSLSDTASGPQSMSASDTDMIVWPESALPFLLQTDSNAQAAIAAMLPIGTRLATGLQRVEPRAGGGRDVYNSIVVIDDDGLAESVHDKVHLVPFGEFLPFQKTLEGIGLRQLTRIVGGFTAADGRTLVGAGTSSVPPALPLICYEIAFSADVARDAAGAAWILNVTNDAWFGRSTGPYQHFLQARLRAVELGIPVVRAANTGISAFIGPRGRVLAALELGERGIADRELPAALPATFYREHWRTIRWGVPFATVLLGFLAFLVRKR